MSQFKDLYGVLYLVAKQQERKRSRPRKLLPGTSIDWMIGLLGLSGDPYERLYDMICELRFRKGRVQDAMV